jgi:GTPase
MNHTDRDQLEGVELPTRAGYVALIGFPNAGKSSLLNQLIEQKLSIVTPLPQTTRERVVGIDTRDGAQMVFVDTPGLVDPRYLLHSSMLHAALDATRDADVILLLVDPLQRLPGGEDEPFRSLAARAANVVVVVNKTDVAPRAEVEAARRWAVESGYRHVLEVSALTGAGVEELRKKVGELLPAGPYFYPPDEISAQPIRFFVAEFVREAAFELYKDEIPYSVTVKVEEYRETAEPIYIRATIFVERASQKGILIGQGGRAIRRLGEMARGKIEAFVDAHVYLDLWIKVLPSWRKDPKSLQQLGYSLPPKSHG